MNTDKIYAQQVANEYHPKGIMAVITTWLEQDCQDPPDRILTLLQSCIPRPSTNHSDQ